MEAGLIMVVISRVPKEIWPVAYGMAAAQLDDGPYILNVKLNGAGRNNGLYQRLTLNAGTGDL